MFTNTNNYVCHIDYYIFPDRIYITQCYVIDF